MKRLLAVVVILALGVTAGIGVQRYWLGMQGMGMSAEIGTDPGEQVLFYRHPMNPSITSDRPAKDNMGMDYIPIYDDGEAGAAGEDGGTVRISPAVVNNMGVRTAGVEHGPLAQRIDTVGYISYNENQLHHAHLRTEGWIENLAVKFQGERVEKGDPLFGLYSPELVNAQEEYVQALSTGNKLLLKASRNRLRALGVPEAQIDTLEKTRQVEHLVKSYAHQDGVVNMLNVREGMYVEPDTEAMSIVSLASVWVMVDVFEQQAEGVEIGQQAEIRLSYLPGRVWTGKVEYIYPSLDPVTRSLKVRLSFENPGELLKPNMFADVMLIAKAAPDTLSIPREALIRTGTGERVIMALGDGEFAAREVQAGMESDGRVEITEGLKAGEQVVTSGQFLIDSESSLTASLQRLTANDTAMAPAENEATQTASGTGVVKAVKDTKLNISHGPIASLDWPAMTMDFQLTDPAQAEGIAPGDEIEFEFRQNEDGAYVISDIGPVTGEGS